MLAITLKTIFRRDLERLKKEIELYQSEQSIWKVEKNISNSAGNLCLHLVGNLNTYIGAELGKTGYIRQRDLEFSLKDVPRNELIKNIEDTIQVVENTLDKVTADDLAKEYPLQIFAGPMTTEFFLIHLVTHLNYHLGQVNYHRRLLDQ